MSYYIFVKVERYILLSFLELFLYQLCTTIKYACYEPENMVFRFSIPDYSAELL